MSQMSEQLKNAQTNYIEQTDLKSIVQEAADCAKHGKDAQGLDDGLISKIAQTLHYDVPSERPETVKELSMDIHEQNKWLYQAGKDATEQEKALKAKQKQAGDCVKATQDTGVQRIQRYLRGIKELATLDAKTDKVLDAETDKVDWLAIKPSVDSNTGRYNTAFSVITKKKRELEGKEKDKENTVKVTLSEIRKMDMEAQKALHAFFMHHPGKLEKLPVLCELFEELGFSVPKKTAETTQVNQSERRLNLINLRKRVMSVGITVNAQVKGATEKLERVHFERVAI